MINKLVNEPVLNEKLGIRALTVLQMQFVSSVEEDGIGTGEKHVFRAVRSHLDGGLGKGRVVEEVKDGTEGEVIGMGRGVFEAVVHAAGVYWWGP